MVLFSRLAKSIKYHWYGYWNGWHFPKSMVHSSGSRIAAGTYEPEVSRLIGGILEKGDTFIDAGANVGYFSRLAGSMVGDEGLVYAFEMESANFRALSENTAHLPRVIPVCMGLSDGAGIIRWNRSTHSTCHSLLETGNYPDGTTFSTVAIPLDHFWNTFMGRSPVKMMKVDVEGAETRLLQGMKQMLETRAVRNMVIEYCPALLENAGQNVKDLYLKLSRHFTIDIIEEEYHFSNRVTRIDSPVRFDLLSDHLLRQGEAVNVNLLCRSA